MSLEKPGRNSPDTAEPQLSTCIVMRPNISLFMNLWVSRSILLITDKLG